MDWYHALTKIKIDIAGPCLELPELRETLLGLMVLTVALAEKHPDLDIKVTQPFPFLLALYRKTSFTDEQLTQWLQEGLNLTAEHLELALQRRCDARTMKLIEERLPITEKMSYKTGCAIS